MLDLETLQTIPKGTIFAKGETTDDQNGINMTRSGKQLKWIAKKGYGYDDWAIYAHWATMSDHFVETQGDKVTSEQNIKKLVPCSDEVYSKYRR